MSLLGLIADSVRSAGEMLDPADGIDLLGLLIVGLPMSLPAFAALIVTLRGQRKGKYRRDQDRAVLDDVCEKVSTVRDEVKNDHPDDQNLRDQIDRMEIALRSLTGTVSEIRERQIDHGRDIGGIRDDVGSLRGEAREDRRHAVEDRRNLADLETRINGFIKRVHPGADPL